MPWGRYKQKIKRIRELHAEWSGVEWSQGPHTRRVAHCMRVCSTTRRLDCALAWSSLASESCLLSLALPLSNFPTLPRPYARRY